MIVREFRKQCDLERLRPEWEALLRKSAADTIFLTYEWVSAWWASFGTEGELRLLTAIDDEGVLRGIAPLRLTTLRRSGQRCQALIFIGDGTTDSDYLDFIIERGYECQALAAFEEYWIKASHDNAVAVLNEIPETSVNRTVLKSLSVRDALLWSETDVACGTVRLPATWDEYLGLLKPRFRTKIRSVLRNLEKREDVKFKFCENAVEIEKLLPVLFDLHSRRWAQDGKAGVFVRKGKCEFYRVLSPALHERGRLRFSWLEWRGQILACQYGFVYNGTYSQLQEGYEPASEHWNSGVGLRAWSIRKLMEEGVTEYDFLGGMGRHKSDWGADVKYSKRIVMARPTTKNLIFCRGGSWRDQAASLLRKDSPQKQSVGEGTDSTEVRPSANDWRRKLIADCYFGLRLPSVTRPLRNRYQVSFSGPGHMPVLTRRKQSSARILYYHRVNDDGDPFFPAISTSLFEKEMRHLARNYNVLALPDLVKHLQDGPPEPVVAITFDDGYKDNCENAFPVLQRYGLPATIFLTTGTMDDDTPIWFEQLAHALKTTTRESLDLEIDVPRRFLLKTQAERLQANNGIFDVLRELSDAERKVWLPRILRELRVADDRDRRGKMLTWDQTRFMSVRGINFGGHTVNHPFLSRLTKENACWEASECKRRIEAELQVPVECFAYPNGRDKDIGPWGDDVIRSAGYQSAVTTIWGMNYQSTNSMRLKRGGPWEESEALFAYKLDWYQLTDG